MRIAALSLLCLLGCAEPPATSSQAPLVASAISLDDGEVLLDVRGDARLIGLVEPVPEASDADRVLSLRGVGLDGRRVLDARFVGDAVVLIDADHGLRVVEGDREHLLDERAEAPLSVVGDAIAYVRGEMPDFEVVRAVPATGEVRALAPGVTPAWSPALSPDGREVLFATSATGTPRLYRSGRGDVESARFPTMPGGPAWRGEVLILEDEAGLAWIDVATGQLVREERGLSGLLAAADGNVYARRGAGYEVIR